MTWFACCRFVLFLFIVLLGLASMFAVFGLVFYWLCANFSSAHPPSVLLLIDPHTHYPLR